jgi:hypothetical protein
MQREFKSKGLALVCVMGLAVGAAACGGGDQTESAEDRGAMATSDTPSQDPAVGGGPEQQQARVSGCLQRGEIDGTFVLTQARGEGEAGSVGTTGSEAAGTEYRLIHTGDTDLSSHVGSRVMVTGRFQSTAAGVASPDAGMQPGSGAPTADTAPGDDLGADATEMPGGATGGTEGTAGASTQIVVENVEHAEGECPAQAAP